MKPLILLFLLLLSIAIEHSLARNKQYAALNNFSSNPADTFEAIEKTFLESDPFIEEIKSDIDELVFKTGNRAVDCRRCCSQGTWTDSRCCIECNNCQLYSDGGNHECNDFPH